MNSFLELDVIVYVLAGLYALVVIIPTVQLLRIFLRIPDLGWTTQKLFLVLTLLSCLVRCVFFVIVPWQHGNFFMVNFVNDPAFTILDTLPSALFFSTYTLLILFWAEIIHHARNQSLSFPEKLRPVFMAINMIVYMVLIAFWLLLFFMPRQIFLLDLVLNLFISAIFTLASIGFVIYGGRLYFMLKQFPIESRGRSSKLQEVGWVTIICTTCFLVRVALLIYGSLSQNIDARDVYIVAYYVVVEVVPSLLVLYILRKLPPRKKIEVPSSTVPFLRSSSSSSYSAENRYDTENYKVNLDIS